MGTRVHCFDPEMILDGPGTTNAVDTAATARRHNSPTAKMTKWRGYWFISPVVYVARDYLSTPPPPIHTHVACFCCHQHDLNSFLQTTPVLSLAQQYWAHVVGEEADID